MIDTNWCFEEDVLKQHVRDFFSKLYTMDYQVSGELSSLYNFPTLLDDELQNLFCMVTGEEVRKAVFSMAPLKAPRVEGFHANFFQTQ